MVRPNSSLWQQFKKKAINQSVNLYDCGRNQQEEIKAKIIQRKSAQWHNVLDSNTVGREEKLEIGLNTEYLGWGRGFG